MRTYVEGGDTNGSHRSEDPEHPQSGQVDRHQCLLVAVGQTPVDMCQDLCCIKICRWVYYLQECKLYVLLHTHDA